MERKENCGVCGAPLVYATDEVPTKCYICGRESKARIYCPQGHYICDACHRQNTVSILKQMLSDTTSRSPLSIAELIMANAEVPMHGPEHHGLVPGVILATYRNLGGPVGDNEILMAQQGQLRPGRGP